MPAIAAALALVTLLAACTQSPPPPLVATPAARTSEPLSSATTQLLVGVDSIAGGYNPHELADQSAVTTALSTLLLPSVFRTAPDGTPTLDRTLMVSAQVTSASPFTVTYQVRTDATWSDGTPVDAADFVYLRNQMTSQPGVIDPAGYRLISRITARSNAKVITVTFAKPYPAWRSLFGNLLPAHLLKDAPGGWANSLTDGVPATAGPFDIKSLDAGAGEIQLERSDRYWERPSVLDQIVLRKTDPASMVVSLRSRADQVVFGPVDATTLTALNALHQTGAGPPPTGSTPSTTPAGSPTAGGVATPQGSATPTGAADPTGSTAPSTASAANAVSVTTVPRAELATVLLRPGAPQLADQPVRAAVAAAVDRAALIATGTEDGPSARLPADSLVVAPSRPEYLATLNAGVPGATPNPAAVPGLLAQAGYVRSATGWSRDGHTLSLVIAAPGGREPYLSIANQLRLQLIAAGIPATVVTPPAAALFEQSLASPVTGTPGPGNGSGPTGPVDIVVGPQPTGGDPATELASWFGCAGTDSTGTPLAMGPLGWCDQSMQPTIDAALSGEMSTADALARVEPDLWTQAVEIPLFQLSDVLAIGPQASGVSSGPPLAGPFFGAAGWRRSTG